MPEQISGFLNISKTAGMTSHDVVARIRRQFQREVGKTKVGHAGTLDPLATGVLVICVGSATRLSEYVMQSRKQYRAQVHLGIETETYDGEGAITDQRDCSHVSKDMVLEALKQFSGSIQQVPPIYSAIKVNGQKLYDLARAGKQADLKPRQVVIDHIELLEWKSPVLVIDVACSAGTYIRSLAHDIGQLLNVGAYLANLIRTRSGKFALDDAVELSTIADVGWRHHLVSPAVALADWPMLIVSENQVQDILHGRMISHSAHIEEHVAMAYTDTGDLLAVMERRDDLWKPHKVLQL